VPRLGPAACARWVRPPGRLATRDASCATTRSIVEADPPARAGRPLVAPHPGRRCNEGAPIFSPCGHDRHVLRGHGGGQGGEPKIVSVDPRTGDADRDDPTIRRCMGFARDWGSRGVAERPTRPVAPRAVDDPVRPDNDPWLRKTACNTSISVAARVLSRTWQGHAGDAATPERLANHDGRPSISSARSAARIAGGPLGSLTWPAPPAARSNRRMVSANRSEPSISIATGASQRARLALGFQEGVAPASSAWSGSAREETRHQEHLR
jgi:hypothetical protein